MRYRIRKGDEVLATVEANSASDAINEFVDEQIPEGAGGGHWRTRDFLKYRLSVDRLSHKPQPGQFELRTYMGWLLLLAATISCLIPGGVGTWLIRWVSSP